MTPRPPRSNGLTLAIPYLWLALFFLLPFIIVLRMSLSDAATALPPYAPHFEGLAQLGEFIAALDLDNFALLLERFPVLAELSHLLAHRSADDADRARRRLSAGLRHGCRAAPLAGHPRAAGDPAVLDLVPDPGLRLGGHPPARWAARQRTDGVSA